MLFITARCTPTNISNSHFNILTFSAAYVLLALTLIHYCQGGFINDHPYFLCLGNRLILGTFQLSRSPGYSNQLR